MNLRFHFLHALIFNCPVCVRLRRQIESEFLHLEPFTIYTIRQCTFLMKRRLAPAALMSAPNLRTPDLYIVLRLSRDSRPLGSLHLFRSGQILNPYPHHYSTAFAFSEILYPHSHRLALRLAFP
ncbi:Uncharacterized protein dnl_64365 [Desulfonema limicola]|uniref:Uncharacterized protein n=1 Tax=Desulfonema limicola TaxID=45656 RepID=A0A975BER1_9BACT|nr:Uncharacterized protein dnl_64365 [Desulfonema limicola]